MKHLSKPGWFVLMVLIVVACNRHYPLPEDVWEAAGRKKIDLAGRGLGQIPPIVFKAKDLEVLLLDGNKLDSLPKKLWGLQNLKELNLARNNLTQLPAEINRLKKLEALNLDDNKIQGLPQTLGDLKALSTLHASRNPLQDIPETMQNIPDLELATFYETRITDRDAVRNMLGNAHVEFDYVLRDDKAQHYYREALKAGNNGEFKRAVALCNQALKARADFAEAIGYRGFMKHQQKQVQAAIQDYNKALQLKENLPNVYLYRGVLFMQQNKRNRACNDWQRARQLGNGQAAEYYKQYCQ